MTNFAFLKLINFCMTNRRDFLKKASMLVASGVVGSSILSGCKTEPTSKHIGLQLSSLRDDVNRLGIQEVLKIAAEIGYNHFETAGYRNGRIYGQEPAVFKQMAADLGMIATSAHLGRNLSENRDEDLAWWDRATEVHAEAGFKYMVMPWSPLSGENATLDNVMRYGEYFNAIGALTAKSGIAFGYHNHAFEFTNKIDDVPLLDLLKAHTNPDYVFFQNDVFWTQAGDVDPVEYLKKHARRIKTLIIKDEKAIGASGTMDFEGIFNQAHTNGIQDWFVNVDQYDDTPQEDVQKSFDFLMAAKFVR